MATDLPSRADLAPKLGRRRQADVSKFPAARDPFAGPPTEVEMRALLEQWIRAGTTPQRLVTRSRIALLALDGLRPAAIADRLGISQTTVRLWVRRFRTGGPTALSHDAPGRGRHAKMTRDTLLSRLRDAGLLRKDGSPVSLRRAAAALQMTPSTILRILRRPGASSQ